MGPRVCAGVLAVSALGVSSHAYAHDPPEVNRIAWAPDAADATSAVFQTHRGFIVGDTKTRSYRWACVEGLNVSLGEEPGFVLLPHDVWMVATEHGLLTSSDQGCTWNAVERFGSAVASALAVAPDDPEHVLVTLAAAADGGLYESRDAGASWKKRLKLAADDYVAQIAIAPSEPNRIYLSGLVIDEQADKFSFQLTRSSDGGATWQRAYIPLAADEDHAVLAAVSPVDPDSVVVLARNYRWGQASDRALYSTDAGATYREISSGVRLTGATFGATGKSIMVAGGESLTRIELNAEAAASSELIGMSQMLSCAQTGPAGLYACGHVNIYDPVVYGASISTDDGATWQSLMSFTEVKERLTCTNEAVTEQCRDQWIDWQLEILVGLGGASIDSVDGWRDFKGIEEVEHPAQAHTLSSARRTPVTGAAGAAGSGDGAAATSSMDAAKPQADSDTKAQSSGCQSAPGRATHGYAWGFFALLWFGVQRLCRMRAFPLRAARR